MDSQRTILIIECQLQGSTELHDVLSEDYAIIEVYGEKESIDILSEKMDEIVAVILDTQEAVAETFALLTKIRQREDCQELPVIISTKAGDKETEKEALRLGAWEFISRPYDEEILKFRVKNVIDRSRLATFQRLKYIVEYDTLTGIYNKSKFFEATKRMLGANEDRQFVFWRIDIERFQLVNAFYGNVEGDRLLKYIASQIHEYMSKEPLCTFGRMEADIFAICLPYKSKDCIANFMQFFKEALKRYNLNFKLIPTCGVYIIADNTESVSRMLDRASLAAKKSKGNYLEDYVFYDPQMSYVIEYEQEFINEMSDALVNEEFQIYLQPKYSLADYKPKGAEALVRWLHPKKGFISPGQFVPIFEKNGFILQLDYYVWEQACKLLRKWLDEGRQPYPISVNVSRLNIYTPDLVDRLCELTHKYQLPHELLQLELTESAYIGNANLMLQVMKELQDKHFTILMDDFGSGYSSLNLLKDAKVDVLKLDMKFLENTEIPGRGENIVSSVVRMAKWLQIPVIAEGAEKEEQVNFLQGIGCEFVQGFFFARPMPVEEYEKIMENSVEVNLYQDKSFNTDELWRSTSLMELLFINVPQAEAIYECTEEHFEILRVNNAYHKLFSNEDSGLGRRDPLDLVDSEYHDAIRNIFREVVLTHKTTECVYRRRNKKGSKRWILLRLRYISKVGDFHIIFANFEDVTKQREESLELNRYRNIICNREDEVEKMLIVDDKEVNRDVLRLMFQKRFTILEAENGKNALEVLAKNHNRVSIILLDLIMPIMNGTEFLEIKRENPDIAPIPVIIISADENSQHQINMLELGANDYIVKPFVEEVLVRRIDNVIESSKRFQEILREYDKIANKARKDSLTGIYNREIAKQLIDHVLINHPEDTNAMIMLDIDDFKAVNDTYGHATGDLALKTLAEHLRNVFRQEDIVGRFGGDEFCVFMRGIPSADAVRKKCELLCKRLWDREEGNIDFSMTISIGIALSDSSHNSFNILYECADEALYKAKNNGKNQIIVYGE